jgi:hypothetical protein
VRVVRHPEGAAGLSGEGTRSGSSVNAGAV